MDQPSEGVTVRERRLFVLGRVEERGEVGEGGGVAELGGAGGEEGEVDGAAVDGEFVEAGAVGEVIGGDEADVLAELTGVASGAELKRRDWRRIRRGFGWRWRRRRWGRWRPR